MKNTNRRGESELIFRGYPVVSGTWNSSAIQTENSKGAIYALERKEVNSITTNYNKQVLKKKKKEEVHKITDYMKYWLQYYCATRIERVYVF